LPENEKKRNFVRYFGITRKRHAACHYSDFSHRTIHKMEVTGRIIVALPEVSGTSSRGNAWKKREYVLETFETYPKKIFFDFFGDRADQYPLNVGDSVKLSFDIESREYNGRWFTSIRGWKSEPAQEGAPMGQPQMQNPNGFVPAGQAFPNPAPQGAAPVQFPTPQSAPSTDSFPTPQGAPNDDLPF